MKRTIMVVLCLATFAIVAIWMGKRGASKSTATAPDVATTTAENTSQENYSSPPLSDLPETNTPQPPIPRTKFVSHPAIASVETAPDEADQLRRSADQLVSAQTSVEQKYAIWLRLRD